MLLLKKLQVPTGVYIFLADMLMSSIILTSQVQNTFEKSYLPTVVNTVQQKKREPRKDHFFLGSPNHSHSIVSISLRASSLNSSKEISFPVHKKVGFSIKQTENYGPG